MQRWEWTKTINLTKYLDAIVWVLRIKYDNFDNFIIGDITGQVIAMETSKEYFWS